MFDLQKDYLPIFYEIGVERNDQLAKEYTVAHDDHHADRELVYGALAFLGWKYAWPWTDCEPTYRDERTNIIKAMAMLLAEIQRLDRLKKKEK